jgi:DNA-binding transcriptional MerR regulator
MLTIGQLADQAGLARSALRYYEEQALIRPAARTRAGYRLYAPATVDRLVFIQRAQRLGFSLADIKAMLEQTADSRERPDRVVTIAEQRYLDIERQLTDLLVLRHELGAFLSDLNRHGGAGDLYERLIARVCSHEHDDPAAADATLGWLLDRTGCVLAREDRDRLIAPLVGRHVHIWRDASGYRVLIPGHDPAVAAALERIAALEAECHAHAALRLERSDEGYVFIAEGDKAFLFAQLFLDLESTKSPQNA